MEKPSHKPPTAAPLYRIITFGCKVNQCDTAGMAQGLAARGWQAAPAGVVPDVLLVNTCTVTARADQQARQAIRRGAREYPGVSIWVTGCYAQRAPDQVRALPGVQAVVGNREKAGLADLLTAPAAAPPGDGPGVLVGTFALPETFQPWPISSMPGHTRAWLKIQDGCSHGCSYCIVPQVRGPRRSMGTERVVAALGELAARGYREVVLTGVNLGQYGQDLKPPGHLTGLVKRLRARSFPLRVRLSSLEPQEVTGPLLEELAIWPHFSPHFHLPLQSGAGPVLKAMDRPYGPEDFKNLVQEIVRLFPDTGLGLDILVGFPGETASHFQATLTLVESLPVTYLHVFPFSPRPGTSAARMESLPPQEIQDRARIMRHLGRFKKLAFLHSQLGQVREVLVEGPGAPKGWLKGLSDNYLPVLLPGPEAWRNQLLKVRFRKIHDDLVVGEALRPPG